MSANDEQLLEQIQFEALIQGLIDHKYGSCDDFISISTVQGLIANMTALNAIGSLKVAGIGNKMKFQKDKSIRNDKVNWIEAQSTNQFEVIYLKKIERFISHLNRTCFTALKTFECHYSLYEKGSFYKRHIDQFKNENGRKYSIVLYLNEDWKPEDEGVLSLYNAEEAQINILPLAGRMVFFQSDEMEHEVHPSLTRDRRSIAGWLKN